MGHFTSRRNLFHKGAFSAAQAACTIVRRGLPIASTLSAKAPANSTIHCSAGPESVLVSQAQAFAYPVRDYLHGSTHQHSLHPAKRSWKSRSGAHDLQELEYDWGSASVDPACCRREREARRSTRAPRSHRKASRPAHPLYRAHRIPPDSAASHSGYRLPRSRTLPSLAPNSTGGGRSRNMAYRKAFSRQSWHAFVRPGRSSAPQCYVRHRPSPSPPTPFAADDASDPCEMKNVPIRPYARPALPARE